MRSRTDSIRQHPKIGKASVNLKSSFKLSQKLSQKIKGSVVFTDNIGRLIDDSHDGSDFELAS